MAQNLKQTAKARGMGGFLQVTQLVQEHPSLEEFFSLVTAVKPVPVGVENASIILVLDWTPIDSCNEVALNQSNTNRIIRFLERSFKSDDAENLIGCAVHFKIKTYEGYDIAGISQYGLAIKLIEPPEDLGSTTGYVDNLSPMSFEIDRAKPAVPELVVVNPFEERRRRIEKRIQEAKEAEAKAKEAEAKAKETEASQTVVVEVYRSGEPVPADLRGVPPAVDLSRLPDESESPAKVRRRRKGN